MGFLKSMNKNKNKPNKDETEKKHNVLILYVAGTLEKLHGFIV